MVKWYARLQNGIEKEGQFDDGSWLTLKDELYHIENYIVSLRIGNEQGTAQIDPNCNGYFIGNKVIATIPNIYQLHLIGIGYHRINESVVRIKWYNKETMTLFITEARPLNEVEQFLIRKNNKYVNELERTSI